MSVRLTTSSDPEKRLDPAPENHTFAELIAGREDNWPTLARALKNVHPARSVFVEWLDDERQLRDNWTQIVRHPYNLDGAAEGADMEEPRPDPEREEQLEKFLDAVEEILIHGVPSRTYSPTPLSTCGGYKHYLGRGLRDDDYLSLRVLRDPVWRVFTHTGYDRDDGPVPLDRPIGEWLAEFSLTVIPG